MAYITSATFDFLRDLAAHNDKEWLDKNRGRYKTQRQNMIDLAAAIYDAFATVDTMPLTEPKKSVARINNNRRFHPDKPPYKTNFGIMINRGEGQCGFYLHVEPGQNFLGAGVYHPARETLDKIRHLIDQKGEELDRIIQQAEFNKTFGALGGDELKTSPRDYPADHPYIHLLRKKDFVVMKDLSNAEMMAEDLSVKLSQDFATALPFMRFIDEALAL